MKFIIIGAGASGILAAISLKKKHPMDDVLIIEHSDKTLKKILATGNGKCNLGNKNLDYRKYSNYEFASKILEHFPIEKQVTLFKEIGFEIKYMDDLMYPISESAVTVREALLLYVRKLGIKINVNENVIDYNEQNLKTDKNVYKFDKLVFATGGKSLPKSGSDGSLIPLLKKHGYEINDFASGLCPIKTKENTKALSGTKVKAKVTLIKDGQKVFDESGEVLFKDHGLSGIVIMNISRIIAREKGQYSLSLDLLESIQADEIKNYIKMHGNNAFLNAYLHPQLTKFFLDNKIDPNKVKDFKFTFDSLSDFEFSQVSVGGIKVSHLNDSLESKLENNIFFIGELVDVDGPCGGYNLTWAFASAMAIK